MEGIFRHFLNDSWIIRQQVSLESQTAYRISLKIPAQKEITPSQEIFCLPLNLLRI